MTNYLSFGTSSDWTTNGLTPFFNGLATNATFITDSGKAFVRAFIDFNRNGIYDAGEPFYCRRVDIGESPDHVEIQVGDFDGDGISDSLEIELGSRWDNDRIRGSFFSVEVFDFFKTTNNLSVGLFRPGNGSIPQFPAVVVTNRSYSRTFPAVVVTNVNNVLNARLVVFEDLNSNGVLEVSEPSYDYILEMKSGRDIFPLTISKSSWDVDQDDILDSWEARNDLDATLFDDAMSDQDNDGLVAVEEFWLGLDPSEPNPVTNSLWGVLSRSIDGRLEAGKSLDYFSNYLPNGRQGIFEINTNCWASDIDFSCLSPWNSRSEHNWNAGTLISPVHIIQADHFHSSIGRTLYFRGKSGVLYSRQLVALRTLPLVENYTKDVAIGLLDSPLPDDVSVAEFLPDDFTEFFGDGKGLPCVTFNQDREAIVGELTEIPGRIVINHNFVSCRVPFSSIRLPFYKDIRRFDSGSPRFLILGDKPILLCTMLWAGEGSGPSLTALKAEIQDAMDSLSPGYSLSIVDFSPYLRTFTPPELDLPQ